MTETQTIIQRQDPAIEAYRLGLLGDVQGFLRDRIQRGELPPDYQVAQLSPAERAAITAAQQGIGGYAPFLSGGSQMIGQGQNLIAGQAAPALQQALGTTGAGQGFINQAAQLSAAQRGLPFQSQAAANQMLQQGLGTGMGLGQQGIGQLLASIGAGQQAAMAGQQGLRGAAGGIGGQVGGAQIGADLAAARARASTAAAQQALMGAAGMGGAAAQQGIASLAGTGGRFDPSQIAPFMGQFEDAAVQQALADISRQGQIAQQGVAAQAVGAGAFGGSRQAVASSKGGPRRRCGRRALNRQPSARSKPLNSNRGGSNSGIAHGAAWSGRRWVGIAGGIAGGAAWTIGRAAGASGCFARRPVGLVGHRSGGPS
jgi:hypothetical protein